MKFLAFLTLLIAPIGLRAYAEDPIGYSPSAIRAGLDENRAVCSWAGLSSSAILDKQQFVYRYIERDGKRLAGLFFEGTYVEDAKGKETDGAAIEQKLLDTAKIVCSAYGVNVVEHQFLGSEVKLVERGHSVTAMLFNRALGRDGKVKTAKLNFTCEGTDGTSNKQLVCPPEREDDDDDDSEISVDGTQSVPKDSESNNGKKACGTDAILDGKSRASPKGGDNQADGSSMSGAWILNKLIPYAEAAGHSIEERIRDCSSLPESVKKTRSGVVWNLVARNRDDKEKAFHEVWRDSATGLLWGDSLGPEKTYSHQAAVRLDAEGRVVSETTCNSELGRKANAGISERKFGMPTMNEFARADKNGLREVLPHLTYSFTWSSSLRPGNSDMALGYSGYNGDLKGSYHRKFVTDGLVRCVGR